MGVEEPKYKIDVRANDLVRIMDGPFKDYEGKVSETDDEKGKVKVLGFHLRSGNPARVRLFAN
jgi:transcriptional antiterminator NusG